MVICDEAVGCRFSGDVCPHSVTHKRFDECTDDPCAESSTASCIRGKGNVSIKFNPHDLWIGVYWNQEEIGYVNFIDVFVCLLPALPIHIQIKKRIREDSDE